MLYDQDTTWKWRAKHKASGKYAQSCHSISPLPPPMHHYRCHMETKSRELWSICMQRFKDLSSCFLIAVIRLMKQPSKKSNLEVNAIFCQRPHASLGFIHVMRLSQRSLKGVLDGIRRDSGWLSAPEFSETQME